VFTGLGFYPVTPGSLEYAIGRPFVNRAGLRLPNGRTFRVVAVGMDDAHPYLGSVSLNGRALDRSFITHQEIMAGGELRFVMQATPNRDWATQPQARPYSMSNPVPAH
jgi:putative alpha-1,2-mannosidase